MRHVLAACAAVAVACPAAAVHADGFYYQQSYGISSARGDAAPMLGESLQLRIALGWRIGAVQIGPWMAGHLAWSREGAYLDFIGGDPEMGDSDLETVGADVTYRGALLPGVSIYVRGGPRYASGLGALDGYAGAGVGLGSGVSLSGKVRALGFLFAPLFFSDRGPRITATLFVDQNVEYYRMSHAGAGSLWLPLVGTSIGFGAGSYF